MVKRLYKDPSRRGMILDDRCHWFDRYASSCGTCKHFRRDDFYCLAYPDGIPDELLLGEELHNDVRKDQTGDTIFEEDDFWKLEEDSSE